MSDNKIGAEIVLTAKDQGASSTLRNVAGETDKIGAAAKAATRAQELLNTDLKAASPAQLQAVEAELKQLAQSGQLAEKELAQVNAKLKEAGAEGGSRLKGVLSGLGGELESLAQKIPGVGQIGAVAGAAVPEVAALVAVLATAVAALKAFSEKQEHTVKLDTALQQTGQLTDEYREKLQKLAGTYGKVMGGGTAWLDVFTRLTQQGADSSNIDKYAAGIKNLAATMDGDVQGASVAFTRALTGHYRELEMLGYQIDKTLPKQQQMESLLKQFADRGAAQAENRTHTLAASFEHLENAGSNFLPALGRIIDGLFHVEEKMEAVSWVLNFLGTHIGGVTPKLDGMSNKFLTLEERLANSRRAAHGAGEALEDDLGGGANAAKEATDNLAKDGLDKLAAAFQNLSEKAREAIRELDEAKRRADALDDAQLGEDLAKIKAGGGTDAEKAKAEREARESSIGRKEKRQDDTDAAKLATLARATADKRSVASGAAKESESASRDVYFNRTQQDYLRAQSGEAYKEQQGADPKRRAELDEQVKGYTAEVDALKKALPGLTAVAEAKKKVADKAQEDADAATKANQQQEKSIQVEQESRHKVQGAERATRKINAGAEDERAKKAREQEARTEARKDYERQIKTGVDDNGKPLTQKEKADVVGKLEALDKADAKDKPVAPEAKPYAERNMKAVQRDRRRSVLGAESAGKLPGDSPTPGAATPASGTESRPVQTDNLGESLGSYHGANIDLHGQHLDNHAASSDRHDTSQKERDESQKKINELAAQVKRLTTDLDNLKKRASGPNA